MEHQKRQESASLGWVWLIEWQHKTGDGKGMGIVNWRVSEKM